MKGVYWRWAVFVCAVFIFSVGEARAQGSAQQSLKQLVEAARKEGQLNWYPVSSLGNENAKEVEKVFNKRFGLKTRISADSSGNISTVFSKAIVESKTGLPPTFDVMYGPDHR